MNSWKSKKEFQTVGTSNSMKCSTKDKQSRTSKLTTVASKYSELNCVPPQIFIMSIPQNVTLFGNRVFADVVS